MLTEIGNTGNFPPTKDVWTQDENSDDHSDGHLSTCFGSKRMQATSSTLAGCRPSFERAICSRYGDDRLLNSSFRHRVTLWRTSQLRNFGWTIAFRVVWTSTTARWCPVRQCLAVSWRTFTHSSDENDDWQATARYLLWNLWCWTVPSLRSGRTKTLAANTTPRCTHTAVTSRYEMLYSKTSKSFEMHVDVNKVNVCDVFSPKSVQRFATTDRTTYMYIGHNTSWHADSAVVSNGFLCHVLFTQTLVSE